ncbi:MAG: LpqB family beta-propeller domain-containing protein [Bryobacteraceae bacterium]
MSVAPGSHLGPYRITALLGAGGMGEVYRAQDDRLGREVAVKVLREEAIADPDRQRRFALEARAASALNHPNILTVYDVGMDQGTPYIVTELVSGEQLKAVIARGPIPLKKTLDLAIQMAAGLAAAHQAGIIHRDVKPANIMITGQGLVKILDFGLAKSVRREATAAGADSGNTAPGFVAGTATYMSPEQAKGEPLDHRTDQFSFGLVVYEMISGQAAFARSSAVSTMAAIVEERARPLAEISTGIPQPLPWCVERCLEKEREGRYASTVDLQRELETIRAHVDEIASGAPVASPELKPRRRSKVVLVLVGLAGLATGVVGTGELLLPPSATSLVASHIRPVTITGEVAHSPVFSNDGKSIAFTAVINGVRQVFVRDLNSPMAAQITNSPTDSEQPFWSPDDSRIYFFSAGPSATGLYAIGATGGSAELIERNASAAAINRRNNALAFLRADSTARDRLSLWIADSGGQPRRFSGRPFDSLKNQFGYLAFSPDGKSLGAWISRWDANSEFWVISWPDGQSRESFSMVQRASPFSWMPDARNVVFGGPAPGSFGSDLQLVDTRSGHMRPLTFFTNDAMEASVSPDGKRIVFVAGEDNFDVISVPLDGSPARTLYGTRRNELDPSWAPGADQFAYSTDRTGTSEIWLHSVGEGWDRPLVTVKDLGQAWVAEISEPNFSPDGRRLAYCVAGGNSHSIYVSAVAGGKPVRLSTENADERSPSWNGDGSSIAFLRNNGGNWSLVKAASGGNSVPTVIREGCLPSHPRWNRANGHWIACVTSDGLTLISEDGKESLPLTQNRWLVFGWSRDGKVLYGISETAARRRIIASIDIETRVEKTLGDLPLSVAADVRGFSLAPDGASFATSVSNPSGDIWTLEGFRQPCPFSWLRW